MHRFIAGRDAQIARLYIEFGKACSPESFSECPGRFNHFLCLHSQIMNCSKSKVSIIQYVWHFLSWLLSSGLLKTLKTVRTLTDILTQPQLSQRCQPSPFSIILSLYHSVPARAGFPRKNGAGCFAQHSIIPNLVNMTGFRLSNSCYYSYGQHVVVGANLSGYYSILSNWFRFPFFDKVMKQASTKKRLEPGMIGSPA